MTSAHNFTIDGALAPGDASAALENLKKWLAADEQGKLQIAPLPAFPELPTQPALQLLFTALAEFPDGGGDRLQPETLSLCNQLLGDGVLNKLANLQSLEAENG